MDPTSVVRWGSGLVLTHLTPVFICVEPKWYVSVQFAVVADLGNIWPSFVGATPRLDVDACDLVLARATTLL